MLTPRRSNELAAKPPAAPNRSRARNQRCSGKQARVAKKQAVTLNPENLRSFWSAHYQRRILGILFLLAAVALSVRGQETLERLESRATELKFAADGSGRH
jgi:hypothetical protein